MNSIKEIDDTTTMFYQQKNKEGYQLFNQTLNTLIQTINALNTYKLENNQINIDEQKLNSILVNAMTAMKQDDTVLLSDILVFDLKPILEACQYELH
ncbi:hypothetical protein I5677_16335 [Mobilitalea sibirica]|uniref:Uncharacterized protein n=1 Tax=Mobilitalea sibirica TaxID=1462919 RepID=A0A8J7KUG6_9FIRM|nr:hypothetical protein [Mobilitalea sibirica]MBH1942471.1 hypothetical protein [Mobilitalea sibirica]